MEHPDDAHLVPTDQEAPFLYHTQNLALVAGGRVFGPRVRTLPHRWLRLASLELTSNQPWGLDARVGLEGAPDWTPIFLPVSGNSTIGYVIFAMIPPGTDLRPFFDSDVAPGLFYARLAGFYL